MKKHEVECNPKQVKLTKKEPIRFKLTKEKILSISDDLKKIYSRTQ